VANDRWGVEPDGTFLGDYSTPERRNIRGISEEKWELCDSLDPTSWGYNRLLPEGEYMSSNELIDYLVDVVSKNGNLLINIGPRADGTIPEVMAQRLRDAGAWLKVNGEAIYATRPWKQFKEGDFRFTRKGKVLYAIALEWPGPGEITLRSLPKNGGGVKDVRLLGHAGALDWRQTEAGLLVTLPARPPSPFAQTLKIVLE